MEEEIKNSVVVWLTALVSLAYCHSMAKFIPKGKTRLYLIIPIVFLFLYLPLNLNTFLLGFTTSFFISWLANFRLLLFAFGKGPLSTRTFSVVEFILLASLPIKMKTEKKVLGNENKEYPPRIYYPITTILQAIILKVYLHRELLHPQILLFLYCFHFYLAHELLFYISMTLARALTDGLELEPGFKMPFLATSIQDFWGRRWNTVMASVLKPSLYDPVRSFALPLVGEDWAYSPAVMVTFFVSGLMHELILYHAGRVIPTWGVTGVFLFQGICMVAEIHIKKVLKGKFCLPRVVSTPLVILFMSSSFSWMFILPMVKWKLDDKAGREISVILDFIRRL